MKESFKKFIDRFFNIIELKSSFSVAIVLAAVCVVVLFALGSALKNTNKQRMVAHYNEPAVGAKASPYENTESTKIYVHVKGEIKSPGLYSLDSGSRVFEAVEMAGGITDNAEVDAINLAQILHDEQEIVIPSKNSPKPVGQLSRNKPNTININKADAAELIGLPGIGEVYANGIIEYRNKNGAFRCKEDIMKVKGISKNRFEQIKDLISV